MEKDYSTIGTVVAVRELTASMTPIADMALLMNKAEHELREELNDPEDPLCEAYHKTKALVDLRMRRTLMAQSAEGSEVAQEALLDIYNNFQNDQP